MFLSVKLVIENIALKFLRRHFVIGLALFGGISRISKGFLLLSHIFGHSLFKFDKLGHGTVEAINLIGEGLDDLGGVVFCGGILLGLIGIRNLSGFCLFILGTGLFDLVYVFADFLALFLDFISLFVRGFGIIGLFFLDLIDLALILCLVEVIKFSF